jgi:uncharacterized RDD family membrane protein YckC
MVASRGRRFGAFLIDPVLPGLATGLLVGILFALALGADSDEATVAIFVIGAMAGLVLLFAYKFILELAPWRATFGTKTMGIRIVAADGSEAGAIIGCEPPYVVFSLISVANPIFFILLAVDDARGWHDRLASTKAVMGWKPTAMPV